MPPPCFGASSFAALPGYPISRIETGQWLPGEGELWSARIEIGD